MQVVIDISEKAYLYIQREWVENDFDSPMIHAMNSIKKGTPLPKGHGDLIDRDALLREHSEIDTYPFPSTAIDHATTIISADKEGD